MYEDFTIDEINSTVVKAWDAFWAFRKFSIKQRAGFLRSIAKEIEQLGDELLLVTNKETNLPEPRLRNERARTMNQLISYADAVERGDLLEIRIDTALPDRTPPRPDIRKMQVPLGPVAVFGAANFPYAYSTAGGDTASALAAGCPVVVKAHPAHVRTSEMVAGAVLKAAADTGMPEGVFSHVYGASFGVGKALVQHPFIKAVGFTGSLTGGRQLFDWANERKVPIPVFAEMSSINPVFLFPQKLKERPVDIAKMIAGSVTLGVGQFCTNPGLIIGIDNEDLRWFLQALGEEIKKAPPGNMLHPGIFKNYKEKREGVLALEPVETVSVTEENSNADQALSTIATVSAKEFIRNPLLHQEVFGPFSLVVRCDEMSEMIEVAKAMEGQLTATLMATDNEICQHGELVDTIINFCGRIISNGVPTGVEVCWAMQHGGPYPASTDSRFGSVGADAIRRFTRPVAYQNWPNDLLPDELKNENPLGLGRIINNEFVE